MRGQFSIISECEKYNETNLPERLEDNVYQVSTKLSRFSINISPKHAFPFSYDSGSKTIHLHSSFARNLTTREIPAIIHYCAAVSYNSAKQTFQKQWLPILDIDIKKDYLNLSIFMAIALYLSNLKELPGLPENSSLYPLVITTTACAGLFIGKFLYNTMAYTPPVQHTIIQTSDNDAASSALNKMWRAQGKTLQQYNLKLKKIIAEVASEDALRSR